MRYIDKKRKTRSTDLSKGFTLVELIVVLVVIAILAAVAVPFMMGFAENAKNKKYINEAKIALTSAETMLSDAYTDGRSSLNTAERHQAFVVSGLGATTEFTIWTQNTLKEADATYKTISSYTIDHALYKTEDGVYVAYDSNYKEHKCDEWTVVDSTHQYVSDRASGYSESNDKTNTLIYVWKYDGQDSASGSAYADASITDEEEKEKDDYADNNGGGLGDTYNQPHGEGGGEQDDLTATLYVTFIGYATEEEKVIGVDFNGKERKLVDGVPVATLSFNDTGFSDSNFGEKISKLFDSSTLVWTYSNASAGLSAPSGTLKNMTDVTDYLSSQLTYENDEASITFTATIKEDYRTVPVSFMAYNKKTQQVSIADDFKAKATTVEAISSSPNTVNYKVGLVSGNIVADENYFSVVGNVNVAPTDETAGGIATHNGNWVPGLYNTDEVEYLNSKFKQAENLSDYDIKQLSDVESWVGAWVQSNIPYDKSCDNDVIDGALNTIDSSKIVFAAPADIHKKVFLEAKVADSVKFKKNNSADENEGNPEIVVWFSKNEISEDIYDVSGPTAKKVDDNYSILGNAGVSLNIIDKKQRLKLWNVYDCTYGGELNDSELNEAPDLRTRYVDDVLDRLYEENEKYGELALVDISALTTRLEYDDEAEVTTPLYELFTGLVSGTNVSSIEYINWADRANKGYYDSGVNEVCLSTTKLNEVSGKLVPEDGDVDVKTYDYDYPAYTVAFTTGNNTIYVFTEDDSIMKTQGSLKGLHSGFSKMTQNSFIEKLDTAEVNNLESMLSGCKMLKHGSTENTLNLSDITAPNVISTANMFSGCSAMISLDLSGFGNTAPALTTTASMFYGCSALNSLVITLNTSQATTLASMFKECSSLSKIATTGTGTTGGTGSTGTTGGTGTSGTPDYEIRIDNTTNISDLVNGCINLRSVVLAGAGRGDNAAPAQLARNSSYSNAFTKAGVGDNSNPGVGIDITLKNIHIDKYYFRGQQDLSKLNRKDRCSSADTNGNKDGLYLFFDSARQSAHSITLDQVKLSNMYSMDYTFGRRGPGNNDYEIYPNNGFTKLEYVTFNNVSIPQLGRMKGLFMNDTNLKKVVFNNFSTPCAWNYSFVFNNCTSLEEVDLGNFTFEGGDAEFYTDYSMMFKDCRSLTDDRIIGLNKINTTNCRDMKYMFANCFIIGGQDNTLDLSNFYTKNVRTDKVEKPGCPYNEAEYQACGFQEMFGTVSGTGGGNNTNEDHHSNLETILVSDDFIVDPKINTSATYKNMFGSGLVNLAGGAGTKMNDATPSNNKRTNYFAWIDGESRGGNDTNTQGYFTKKDQ